MLDAIKRQFRSVIEWNNPSDETLFWKWGENGDEIKNASKLIIGPGQGCIFLYEGQVRAMHIEEGMISLETANIPFITTLSKFMQFFESEHKVGIYFFRLAKVLDQKWGTTSPIKYIDPHYEFPVALKAYGNYSYRIDNPRDFFTHVVAGQEVFTVTQFRDVIGARIVHPLSDFLAESQFSYNNIDANRQEIAAGMQVKLVHDFGTLGFEITDFRIEGTQFDAETEQRINRIADVTAESMAAKKAGLNYSELQQLEALREAAQNEGGAAGAGVGIGAGIGLGQKLTEGMIGQNSNATPPAANDVVARLSKLKSLREADLISEEEFSEKKQAVLAEL